MINKIKCFYRLSDKARMAPGFNYKNCFINFLNTFNPRKEELQVNIESCEHHTEEDIISLCLKNNLEYKITNYGNSLSFYKNAEDALAFEDNTIIYFVENDYIHRHGCKNALFEIFNTISTNDYVSLYDHPDKYYPYFFNTLNQEYMNFCELETNQYYKSIVHYLKSGWWKTTPSTCMTFACTAKVLKEDFEIIKKHTAYFGSERPHDHQMFVDLYNKGRFLYTPMPSYSGHTVMLPPGVDWPNIIQNTI